MQCMRHSLCHRLTLMWHWQSLESTVFITFSNPLETHCHSNSFKTRRKQESWSCPAHPGRQQWKILKEDWPFSSFFFFRFFSFKKNPTAEKILLPVLLKELPPKWTTETESRLDVHEFLSLIALEAQNKIFKKRMQNYSKLLIALDVALDCSSLKQGL